MTSWTEPKAQIMQLTAHRLAELEQSPTSVLFIDIVESVRLMEANEGDIVRRWLDFVAHLEHDLLPGRNGRLVKRLGDGALVEFSTPQDATEAALNIMSRVKSLNTGHPPEDRILLRMGLNVGQVIRSGDQDLYGQHVNLAARLMTLAQPGQIVASAKLRDVLADGVHAEFEDLGNCYLRNVEHPVRAFLVQPRGANLPFAPMMSPEDLLPTIAVVPFMPNSRAKDNFALGEVFAEDIIGALSRSADMNVISRLSASGFRFQNHSLADIGSILNADFILSGVYAGDEHFVILDVELAEVRSSRVIWSQRIRSSVKDLLEEENALQAMAGEIHQAIAKTEMRRAMSNPMPTLESYSLLMAAVALMHRLSPRNFEFAGELLNHLIYRAPNQPEPYAWLARWQVLKVQQGWTDDSLHETQLALQNTKRALDLDPSHIAALVAEGFALTNLAHDLEEAEDRYDHALDLCPNDATGRLLRGMLFAFRGEGAKAVRDTERAMHLAPLDPNRFFFYALAAGASLAAEDYPRALKLAKRSLRFNRVHTSTLRVKAVAEMRLGQKEKAIETAKELKKLQPGFSISSWSKASPSAEFEVGRRFAETLRDIGIPN